MGRDGLEQLLYLLDDAFEGPSGHCFLTNLFNLKAEDWTAVPPGGGRSIRDIVLHVGQSKYAYDDYAFGPGTMRWDRPETIPAPADESVERTLGWLRDGHRLLREHVAALDDGELLKPRLTNWGEQRETRWIINIMIQHDLYHAGEINHVRALLHGNDRWAWELR